MRKLCAFSVKITQETNLKDKHIAYPEGADLVHTPLGKDITTTQPMFIHDALRAVCETLKLFVFKDPQVLLASLENT